MTGRLAIPSLPLCLFAAVAACCAVGTVVRGDPTGSVDFMVELRLDNQTIEGRPLSWDRHAVRLLGRDGRLWEFEPNRASNYRRTADRFRPYRPSELRAELLRELGSGYEVSGTTHYLVAHTRHQRHRWAELFESVYRQLVSYVAVRGFKTERPPFPLVAIVCRDQRDFMRYASRQGGAPGAGVLGYYDLLSNRIIVYDMLPQKEGKVWQENADVVIHEVTHQVAFNTGVHSRYHQPPVWVAEGLATMFEAPGVHNAHDHPSRAERINRGRLEDFRRIVVPRHKPELIKKMIASDSLFSNATVAYAEAWALTFFLAETRGPAYARYLARTANKPAFRRTSSAERLEDFTSIFGDDWKMLEARLLRFIESLE